jgi:hypothetical protein
MPEPSRPFVILHHVPAGPEHWDLMLDAGERLVTWQLLDDPRMLTASPAPGAVRARRIADHRRAYLDYEGPVSGGRGSVSRVDRGHYALVEQQADRWVLQLAGVLLNGRFQLTATHGELWELQRVES